MPVLPNTEFTSTSNSTNVEAETSFDGNKNENIATITIPVGEEEPSASFDQYLMSIVYMPHSLRMVCLTNLFCWMAHVRICNTFYHFNILKTILNIFVVAIRISFFNEFHLENIPLLHNL